MQLKNNLYRILDSEIGSQEGKYLLRLNPEHFIYKAHFPGKPITPGVCIVQMAKELLEEYLSQTTERTSADGMELQIVKVKNVKFLSVISPKENNEIMCKIGKLMILEETHEVNAQIVVSSKEEIKAKISLTCKQL